jgi:hypothetical protein
MFLNEKILLKLYMDCLWVMLVGPLGFFLGPLDENNESP